MAVNLIEQFRSDCIIRNISSLKNYVLYTQEFLNFLEERGKEPTEVTKNDLKAYLAKLKDRGLKQHRLIVFLRASLVSIPSWLM